MHSNLTRNFFLLAFLALAPLFALAQPSLQFKLQLMPDGERWGVYVKPVGVTPSPQTITGSGQVTVVMPKNYPWSNYINVSGTWIANQVVHGPVENPTKSYLSFTFTNEFPHINLQAGQETLLFTFKGLGGCPDSLYLFNNSNDPFLPPNSVANNPGNEMTVFDPVGGQLFEYQSNYAHSAWSCHDNDEDGVLNAHEDTNGNGVFDAGVDASNLNVHNNPGLQYKLQLMPDGERWGVYVKPVGITPSPLTITGSAQVTVVMPLNYPWSNLVNVSGTWAANAIVHGPTESPTKSYISVGMVNEFPHIDLQAGQETLLFTFKGLGGCPDSIYLINNSNDPFIAPNGIGSNPLNEMTVLDPVGDHLYEYRSNYATSAWSCHDNDGDGVLNAHEDTNGNGVFDAGVDASDLNVSNCPNFTDHPDDIAQCSGEAVLFCATATTSNSQWAWQENTGTGWVNLENDTFYNGVHTACLSVAYHASLDGNQYRAVIWSVNCDTVYSNAAIVDVEGPITVTDEPDNITQCAGEGVTFSAAVAILNGSLSSLQYQWEYSSDNGMTWFDMVDSGNFSGVTTSTVSIADVAGMYGYRFRLRYRTPICDAGWTNYAVLTVSGPITVTDQPDDVDICTASEVYLTASFEKAGVGTPNNPQLSLTNYSWQISTDGGISWANITNNSGLIYTGVTGTNIGATGSDTLTISNAAGLGGNKYRIAYTTPTCSIPVYSNAATLNLIGSASFSDDPDDITVCAGNDTIFTATASIPQGSFSFGWQYSDNNGATWTSIVFPSPVFSHSLTGAVASGTDVLSISNVAGMYNRRFRAVAIATDCGSVYSDDARLSIQGPLTVVTQPVSVVECAGNATVFSARINNPGVPGSMIVNWQIAADTNGVWTNLPSGIIYNGTNNINQSSGMTTLSISNVAGLNGFYYRLAYRTSTCNVQYTHAVRLVVEGPITVTDQPDDMDLCAGEAAYFTSTASLANAGTLTHQWQLSSDGFNYSDINTSTDGGIYTGFNSTTLNISNSTGLYHRKYRLAFSSGECNRVFSQAAQLNIDGPISFTDHPDNTTGCPGQPVQFCATAITSSLEADSLTQIKWQWQENTGAGWADLENATLYNGVYTRCLSIFALQSLNGNQYRAKIWTNNCDTLYANAATLNVIGQIEITSHPQSLTGCPLGSAIFTSSASSASSSPLTNQWQLSADGGNTWQDITQPTISLGSISHGVTGYHTNTLVIEPLYGLNLYLFRNSYSMGNCQGQTTEAAVLFVEDNINCGTACLQAKLQYTSNPRGWAVMAQPFNGYLPTGEATTLEGHFTVVAPLDFEINGVTSMAGNWYLSQVEEDVPGFEGSKLLHFELAPATNGNGHPIGYAPNAATPLFHFPKLGSCPEHLYLLEDPSANLLTVQDHFTGQSPFQLAFCGVFDQGAWECPTTLPGYSVALPGDDVKDSLQAPSPAALVRDVEAVESQKAEAQTHFAAFPNPTSGIVNISLAPRFAEGQATLALFDLQGKKRLETVVKSTSEQLDLSGLPAGVYLVSLAQNGRMVERVKVVKN